MTTAVVIALLSVAVVELGGAIGYWLENGRSPYSNLFRTVADAEPEVQATELFKQRLHPYFGFAHPYLERHTGERPYSINNMGFPPGSKYEVPFVPVKDDFVVVVFGGSVAANLVGPPQRGSSIQAALAKQEVLKGRNVIVYSMAQGSGKQPQQLIALNLLLALGQHIDLAINVDGFNEAALGYTNYTVGMHPILPAAQIVGALALKLQVPGEGTVEFYELAYGVSSARAQIAMYQKRLPFSSTGLAHLANKVQLASNEERLRELLPRYESAIKASGDWEQAKKQLSLDMPYASVSENRKYEDVFELWLRSSRQMRLLSLANQIGYVHVIQPYLLRSKPKLTPEERAIAESVNDSHPYKQPASTIYQMFQDRRDFLKTQGIASAIDLFAEQTQTMYVDPFHYSARGETIFAEFIAGEAARWIAECHPEPAVGSSKASARAGSGCERKPPTPSQ